MLLNQVPDREEIINVVKNLASLKAPSPYGLPACFFQRYWPIVGDRVVAFIQDVFQNGSLLQELNFTYVVFIPKEGKTSTFFWSVSNQPLQYGVYKILPKLIANRIRPFLDKFISTSQAAFVPSRWIAENTILAHEIGHCMKKKKGKGVSLE